MNVSSKAPTAQQVLAHFTEEVKNLRVVAYLIVGLDETDNARIWTYGPNKSYVQMKGAIQSLDESYTAMIKSKIERK